MLKVLFLVGYGTLILAVFGLLIVVQVYPILAWITTLLFIGLGGASLIWNALKQ